jgi:hypothetical protein
VIVRSRGFVPSLVGMRSHHDWHAFTMSSDGIDGVKAGKRWSSLLLSDQVLEDKIDQHLGCVSDLQTGLTTARVDGQVLKLAHVHVDVGMMGAVNLVVRKPLTLRSKQVVVRREGTCLVSVVCWCNRSIGQKGTDKYQRSQPDIKRPPHNRCEEEHKSSPVESEWVKRRKTTG